MTTVAYPHNDLGSKAFTGNGTATSDDYAPDEGKPVALYVVADQAGTAEVFEIDNAGVARSLGTPVAFSANATAGSTAEIHFINIPVNKVRVVYTNTSNTAGTASFRAERS